MEFIYIYIYIDDDRHHVITVDYIAYNLRNGKKLICNVMTNKIKLNKTDMQIKNTHLLAEND